MLQPRFRGKGIEQIVRRKDIVLRRAIPVGQVLEVAQRTGHHQQFAHGEHAAFDRSCGQRTDALHPAETGRAILDQERIDGIRLLQCITHFIGVALRLQCQKLCLGFLAHTALNSTGDDLIEF